MSGEGGSSTAWYGPVLGEAYRSRRCVSATPASVAAVGGGVGGSAAAMAPSGTKKSSTSTRLPKTPRLSRTLQMFASVKRGVQLVYEHALVSVIYTLLVLIFIDTVVASLRHE